MTNDFFNHKSLVIFLGFLKMIKLLVILFIIKLYARNNIFKNKFYIFCIGIRLMTICLYHCVKSLQIRSFFCSVYACIRTEYGEILLISLYSVRIRENTDQKNSVFEHFSRIVCVPEFKIFYSH